MIVVGGLILLLTILIVFVIYRTNGSRNISRKNVWAGSTEYYDDPPTYYQISNTSDANAIPLKNVATRNQYFSMDRAPDSIERALREEEERKAKAELWASFTPAERAAAEAAEEDRICDERNLQQEEDPDPLDALDPTGTGHTWEWLSNWAEAAEEERERMCEENVVRRRAEEEEARRQEEEARRREEEEARKREEEARQREEEARQREEEARQREEEAAAVAAAAAALIRAEKTPENDWGGGSMIHLDRHNVTCGDDGLIGFSLKKTGNNTMFYEYTCRNDINTPLEAQKNTGANDWGGNHLIYLDRHTMDCGKKAIGEFKFTRPAGNKIMYNYKCSGKATTGP